MKSLRQLYGNVDGYNMEEEYLIIERTIEHEKEFLQHAPSFADVFRGVNLVCRLRTLYSSTMAAYDQKRTLTIMLLAACGQLGGLSIISTYSTCKRHWSVQSRDSLEV